MINFKQEELIEQLMNLIQNKFPEVELIKVMESPEDPESLWIEVTAPDDEDREMELSDFSCEEATDIFLDYGYHMLVSPVPKKYVNWPEERISA